MREGRWLIDDWKQICDERTRGGGDFLIVYSLSFDVPNQSLFVSSAHLFTLIHKCSFPLHLCTILKMRKHNLVDDCGGKRIEEGRNV